mgnify:CR=1 FL=1|jgi:hypothetical protein
MLTKRQLVDLVIENKSGGAAPDYKRFHPNVVMRALDLALSALIADEVKQQQQGGEFVLDSTWIKTFDGKKAPRVKRDPNSQQLYIELPARIISLNRSAGLRELSWAQGWDSPMQIVDAQAYSVLGSLECSVLPAGVYFAQVEGGNVYFPNMPSSNIGKRMVVKMICGPDGYENDEVLPIPDARTADILMLMDKMFAEQKVTKVKMSNDSNPNTA